MKFRKWEINKPDPDAVSALREAGAPDLLAQVLSARGISTPQAAHTALKRDQKLTLSPLLMRDMDKAVARIRQAVERHETVAVFGDYDVDGITSTVLLSDYLKRCGVRCLRYIPRRIEDGYGLSKPAVQHLREQGADLMITVDCGITGTEEVAYANSLGLDVVVTDHHECMEELPDAAAVVDPHRHDCPYPFKYLAGCGVALKLVLALGGPEQEDELFRRYCPLAALGTIADVMRMEDENRTIVSCGLDALPNTEFIGIQALLREIGLWGKPVSSIQIGFVLSPRINAAGRMGKVDLAVDLLETEDPARAEELAKALCELNRERQAVEQEIYADAVEQIHSLPPEQHSALVLSSDRWHQGVVGIVASRLCEQYGCPCFMIYLKGNWGKGSCRTVGGLNLFEALEHCSDLLQAFGGHALAAGFTIARENLDAFRTRMNAYVQQVFGTSPPVSTLTVDVAVDRPGCLTLEETAALSKLEPYGSGNARPVFALLGAVVKAVQDVGQGRHMKLRLARGNYRFDAIFFAVTTQDSGIRKGMRVDAAFYLQPNTFRDVTTLQLQLLDIRPSIFPTKPEAEARDIIRRLVNGETLSNPEINRLQTTRKQFASCWRGLVKLIPNGGREWDILPLLRELAEQMTGGETFLRSCFALEVFRERGLVDVKELDADSIFIRRNPKREKVVLEDCPYFLGLRYAKKSKKPKEESQ